jgi:glycerate-2-kinase
MVDTRNLSRALSDLSARRLLSDRKSAKSDATAILCWGKAAWDFYRLRKSAKHALVISPDAGETLSRHHSHVGEHPIPGLGSLRAGVALVEFFMELRGAQVKKLDVYLSGGASSIAWLLPELISYAELFDELTHLYQQPLTIQQLNRRRAKFDLLKAGGSAKLAHMVSPDLKIQVYCVSDVMPFGLESIGSGPFFNRKTRHILLADNSTLRKSLAKTFKARDEGFVPGDAIQVRRKIIQNVKRALKNGRAQTLVFGCEPSVSLLASNGRGGRQTHLACLLLTQFLQQIKDERLEIICSSSDGSDGNANASGAALGVKNIPIIAPALFLRSVQKAIDERDTATFLNSLHALIPNQRTGTNVQDVVIIRVL